MTTENVNVAENLQSEAAVEATQRPVFEEITEVTEEQALNVLIQAANLAQASGRLTVRDSVLLARSIDVLRPGTI
jgi:histone H3/H4